MVLVSDSRSSISEVEEEGEESATIGVLVGGSPPKVQPDDQRRFDVIQRLWHLGQSGKALCEDVSPGTTNPAVEGAAEGSLGFTVVILLLVAGFDFKL